MGTGKMMKCNECNHEWMQLEGVGLQGKPYRSGKNNGKKVVCPNCGSDNIGIKPKIHILWD